MKRLAVFLALILLVGCQPGSTGFQKTKIWDIYTDMLYENPDSFVANLEKRHPAEFRMIRWLKDNNEWAYNSYLDILMSNRSENTVQLTIKPECYFLEEGKEPINQKQLLELFKSRNIMPAPFYSPHASVVEFIEALANGSIGVAPSFVAGEFAKSFDSREIEVAYWNGLAEGNLYARTVVRKVEMSKDLKSAKVYLELIFFTSQKSSYDKVTLVSRKIGYDIKLSEEGTWLITNQF